MKRILIITLGLTLPVMSAQAGLIYYETFDAGAGANWSRGITTTTSDNKRTFLGEFGAETVRFQQNNLSPHSTVTVQFEVMIIRTWDGNGDEDLGPDRLRVEVQGGPLLMDATFMNSMMVNKNWVQSFPDNYGEGEHPPRTGAIENDRMPFFWFNRPISSVYRMTYTFAHSGSSLAIDFSGINLQQLGDESWGLDNVLLWLDDTGPFVTINPQPDYAPVGGELHFEVYTAGQPPLSYQWLKDGSPIPDATQRTLSVSNAQLTDSGTYSVRVGNADYELTSGSAEGVVFEGGPQKLWDYPLPKNAGTPGLDADGNVYVGSVDRNVYAFDRTGNLKWARQTQGTVSAAPIFDSDGHIIVSSRDGTVFCFNPDGSTNWMAGGIATDGSPSRALNGDLYFGSRNKVFTSLSATGTTNWQYTTGAAIEGSTAIDAYGRVYFTTEDGHLYCFNAGGSMQWDFQWSGYAIGSSPTIAPDGSILFGSTDGNLYSVSSNRFVNWGVPTVGVVDGSAVYGPDGSIYYGAGDRYMSGLDNFGFEKWIHYVVAPVTSTPVVTDDHTVIVGPVNQRVLGMDTETGAVKWALDVGLELSGSSPVLDQNGRLYVGAGNAIHVFQTQTRPANSSWPQFRRTPANAANVAAPTGLPPAMTLQSDAAGGIVTLQLEGEPYKKYRIDFSDDSQTWSPLQNLETDTPPAQATDSLAHPHRIYRAIVR